MHRTKDGREIPLREMGDIHLLNTLALISKKAASGVTVRSGGLNDFWYDEDLLTGKDALEYLSYNLYLEEAKRRRIV